MIDKLRFFFLCLLCLNPLSNRLWANPEPSGPALMIVNEALLADSAMKVRTRVSTKTPWQRQQVIIRVEVEARDAFAGLAVSDPWNPPGFEVIPLPATRVASAMGKGKLLGIGWALLPLVAGEQQLELPRIHYRLSGAARYRYLPPPVTLTIKPLPPYVPPTMPVGKIEFSGSLTPAGYLPVDHLAYWTMNIRAEALTPRWLPPIRHQVDSSDVVQFLPETIHRAIKPDQQGIHGQIEIQFPFKPLRSGRLKLPELRLDYFDPETGRLVRRRYAPQRPIVYSRPVAGGMMVIVLLAIFWLGWRFYRGLQRVLQRQKIRREWLEGIAQAETPRILRHQLTQIPVTKNGSDNLSLQQWGVQWRQRYPVRDGFDQALQRLSQACYAQPAEYDFISLKSELRDIVQLPCCLWVRQFFQRAFFRR